MHFKRVKSLEGLAVFDGAIPKSDETDFCKFNLIYGFNGCGKTTLSRVFASLERGEYCADLPQGGRFELELDDGVIASGTANLDRLKGQIAVFNQDFVETNFRWRAGSANAVFYLGEEQAGLATEFEEAKKQLQETLGERDTKRRDLGKADATFVAFKRDTARNIAEQFGLGRSYVATQLDRDYAKGRYPDRLSETEQSDLRGMLAQTAPLAKINALSSPTTSFASLIASVQSCLSSTVGTIALADLREHQAMLQWAKQGLDYHREHDLLHCLFCGNEVGAERFAALDAVVDDRLSRIGGETDRLLHEAATMREELAALAGALPSENDVSEGQAALANLINQTADIVGAMRRAVRELTELLELKKASPNVDLSTGNMGFHAITSIPPLARSIGSINEIISSHNAAHDQFETRKQSARDRLMGHYLGLSEDRYRSLEKAQVLAADSCSRIEGKADEIGTRAEQLRRRLLQHGPAAEAINALVRAYLRHGNIEIVAALDSDGRGEGFKITRDGADIVGVLSEGEKTAIALCYFISTLSAEGRRIRDLIVVVDDPISSLDTRALNYAFSVLKSQLSGAKQVFILTHNMQFMSECRKWLRNMSKKDPPEASLLFIDVRQEQTGRRRSQIQKLPKLLRDYESEYHYLFGHLIGFANSEGLDYDYFYLMPNAMRKILDIFLAFKQAGPEGLAAKVERATKSALNLDGNQIKALDRLVQLESHAENLDDLVTFSSMTIEEGRDCARSLVALIAETDKGHYDRLVELCR